MGAIFENKIVNRSQPGFADMRDFFMSRNPGATGAILGRYGEVEFPTPMFLDTLRTGLTTGDAAALTFRYRSTADLMGARNVVVSNDRFGWPVVAMRGDVFPNTTAYLDMAFLKNGHMAWVSHVYSDRLVLPSWEGNNLGNLTQEGGKAKLNSSGFYPSMADAPDIVGQLESYPDLVAVLVEMSGREDDLTQLLSGVVGNWKGNWSIQAQFPPSPAQEQFLERYGVFYYAATIDFSALTLNDIVDQTRLLVPVVQEAYAQAESSIVADRFIRSLRT